LKKQRTDFLVEKCTELGVRKFFPVISQNTQTQRVTLKRLKSQVIEAVEQCGGTFIPQIEELTDLKKVVDSFPKDRRIIFCDETLEFDNIQKVLGGSNFEKVGIFIGPEGGFSLNERKMLKKKVGAVSVSLGSRVLRAETAAVSALTAWHTVSGDWVK
jgi:16S rRNA (uracil1498-N3)-methyltransferase